MARLCSVTGCTTKDIKNLNIMFHKFPQDETLKKKWLDILDKPWFRPTRYSFICSKHFSADDYEINTEGTNILKPDAIPQLIARENIHNDRKAVPTASTSNIYEKKHRKVKRQFHDLNLNDGRSFKSTAPKRDMLIPIDSAIRAEIKVNVPIEPITKSCVPIDSESIKGRIGWQPIAKLSVPYIIRVIDNEHFKFVSVRIAEIQLLSEYLPYLHKDIFHTCVTVKSYFITRSEAKLLDELNIEHCKNLYGTHKFIPGKDIIVHLEDLFEFYAFIKFCFNKLKCKKSPGSQEKCGYIKINPEDIVPYCVIDMEKYIPIFFFQGESIRIRSQVVVLKNWDLAYIKFCCMVMGITDKTLLDSCCEAINLNDIKIYFASLKQYEAHLFWPEALEISSVLLVNQRHPHVIQPNAWIKLPPAVEFGLENCMPHTSTVPVSANNMPIIMNTDQNILQTNQMTSAIMPQRSISKDSVDHTEPLPPRFPVVSNALVTSKTVSNSNLDQQIHNTLQPNSGNLKNTYTNPQQHNDLKKIQPVIIVLPKSNIGPPSLLLTLPQTEESRNQFVNIQSTSSSQHHNRSRNNNLSMRTQPTEIIDLTASPHSPILVTQTQEHSGQNMNIQSTSSQQHKISSNNKLVINTQPEEIIDLSSPPHSPILVTQTQEHSGQIVNIQSTSSQQDNRSRNNNLAMTIQPKNIIDLLSSTLSPIQVTQTQEHSGQNVNIQSTSSQQLKSSNKLDIDTQPEQIIDLSSPPHSPILVTQTQEHSGQIVNVQSTSSQQRIISKNNKSPIKTQPNEIIDLSTPPTSPVPPTL